MSNEKTMIEYILDIDAMTTVEFCNEQGIPHPVWTGDIKTSADQFLQVDAIKHRLFVSHAKKLHKSKPIESPTPLSAEEFTKQASPTDIGVREHLGHALKHVHEWMNRYAELVSDQQTSEIQSSYNSLVRIIQNTEDPTLKQVYELQSQVEGLTKENSQLNNDLDLLGKDRDFFYEEVEQLKPKCDRMEVTIYDLSVRYLRRINNKIRIEKSEIDKFIKSLTDDKNKGV